MSDQAGSGNRWEPMTPQVPPERERVDTEPRAGDGAGRAARPHDGEERPGRSRALVAGLAAALLLGGGAGGYAAGHALAADGDEAPVGHDQGRAPGTRS